MKTTLPKLLVALAVLLLSLHAKANIIVTLEPTPQTISVGSPVSMDLVISGLGNFSAPSLGGFSFDLNYNPAVLSATSLSFGSQLDLGIFGSLRFSDLSTPGSIHLDEVSFESSGDLAANQPSSFTLATLGFTGIGPGISGIGFSFGSLSDENGQSLQFLTSEGQVTVNGSTGIPDGGSTLVLLAIGMAVIWLPRVRCHLCQVQ